MIDINRAEKQGLAAASKEALTSCRHPSTVQPPQPCQHANLSTAAAELKLQKDTANARVFIKDAYLKIAKTIITVVWTNRD